MNADLKQQIREFIAEVNDPASLTTTREHLAKAVVLLREAVDGVHEEDTPHTCKFCGAQSWIDPSEQTAPPDYCHESDHGEPEPTDG